MSGLTSQALISALESVVLTTGRFERANAYEPKTPPGSGLTAAIWVQDIKPVPSSGLASTSVLFVARIRLFTNMLQEPQEQIDPQLCDAVDDVMGRLSGGFTLGGIVREVDLLGESGVALTAQAAYVTVQQTMYRIYDITVPLVVNDAWTQGA